MVSRAWVSGNADAEEEEGDDEEVERFQKTLDLREKGMVYVKGIFDQ